MRKTLRAFSWIMLVIVGPAALAEILLRADVVARRELFLRGWISREAALPADLEFFSYLNHRLWGMFLANPPQDHRVVTDRPVIDNYQWRDPAALAEAYRNAKLPPRRRWESWDFLRPDGQRKRSGFTVTSNGLGFRDPERPRSPRGVRRVLVLGAYQAFGHGVDDGETYPRALENILRGRRIEVWNAGVQTTSAISGLALLRKEFDEIRPSVVVLDYGFVDAVASHQHFLLDLPARFLGPDSRLVPPLVAGLRGLLAGPAGRSYLLSKAASRAIRDDFAENVGYWREVNREILRFLAERNVPAVLLDQYSSLLPAEEYSGLVKEFPGTEFLSVRALIGGAPALPADDAGPTWVDDFSPRWRQFIRALDNSVPYRADLVQLNHRGYRLVAEALAPIIVKKLRAPGP